MNMKPRAFLIVIGILGCLMMTIAFAASLPDGVTPPHAKDTDGNAIPESSATQPAKPIILSLDIHDDKYGEMKNPDAAFDHSKHNTDVKHTLDGVTLTNCVYCHHTEQPSASGGETYLKTFKRTAVLTAAQLDSSKEPVKSCRACHFQKSTPATDEYPPKSVSYPRDLARRLGMRESGDLTNDNAYHIRCISCHDAATKRDATLKAPTGCPDCHIKKSSASTASTTPSDSPTTTPTVSMTSTPTTTPTTTPTATPSTTPTESPTPGLMATQ